MTDNYAPEEITRVKQITVSAVMVLTPLVAWLVVSSYQQRGAPVAILGFPFSIVALLVTGQIAGTYRPGYAIQLYEWCLRVAGVWIAALITTAALALTFETTVFYLTTRRTLLPFVVLLLLGVITVYGARLTSRELNELRIVEIDPKRFIRRTNGDD